MLFTNGDLSFVRKKDAISQHAGIRLRTWLGESPYDLSAGVPYRSIIFQPGTPVEAVRFILEQNILGTPGITGVKLDYVLDPQTRALTVTGTATGDDIAIDFSIQIEQ